MPSRWSIAADESVMPQTREHFEICRLLGVERGVVVLTKTDRVDADAIGVATLEARELVAGSFLQGAAIVAVSSRTGEGLDDLRAALAGLAGAPARQQRRGVVRLPVDRVFTVRGFGAVVTGTLVSGEIAAGQDLVVLPEGRDVRVRGLQVHGGDVPVARAPSRTAVNLGAVDAADLARGVTLASPGTLSVTRRLDVRIDLIGAARPLRHGASLRAHQGTAERRARVAVCATRDRADAAWQRADVGQASVEAPPGGVVYARLRLDGPVAVTRGDRIILRTASPMATIGGAIVLNPLPPVAGLRRASTFERFRAMDVHDDDDVPAFVRVWLDESAEHGLSPTDLVARGGLGPDQSARVAAALVASGDADLIDTRLVAVATRRRLTEKIVTALEAFHTHAPREPGMAKEELRQRVAARARVMVFEHAVAALVADHVVVGADRLALATHRSGPTEGEAGEATTVENLLRAAGLMPPDEAAMAAASGLARPAVDRALRELVRAKKVARLQSLHFHVEALAVLKREVVAFGKAGQTDGGRSVHVDVATFKTRYGLSRKFAIPLLEWLDRERVTRRIGDTRIILGG